MGQMEMKCILIIPILAKATQVSDVAHGPLVIFIILKICKLTFGSPWLDNYLIDM
jgi:hypothetical protein